MNTDTEQRVAQGLQYHKEGYNCAQCVALALHDLVGWDAEDAALTTAPLGRGIAGLMETCGCVTGMALIAAHAIPAGNPADAPQRAAQKQLVQAMTADFRDCNGEVVCRRLLGIEPTEGVIKKTCALRIADAIRIATQHITQQ